MKYRKKISRKKSNKVFRKGLGVHRKNQVTPNTRGGIRF